MGSQYTNPDIEAVLFIGENGVSLAQFHAACHRLGFDLSLESCEWSSEFQNVRGVVVGIPFCFQARVCDPPPFVVKRYSDIDTDSGYKVAEFRQSTEGTGGFDYEAIGLTRAVFVSATRGTPLDENYSLCYSPDSFLEAMQLLFCGVRLDIEFVRAGANGLPLDVIREIVHGWETPEDLAERGLSSCYMRVPDGPSGYYRMRKNSRDQKLLALKSNGFRMT